MKLKEAKLISKKLILEYAKNTPKFMDFGGVDGTNARGKKMDNIATGEAEAYKDNTYYTKYEKLLPNLCKLTQQAKTGKYESNVVVNGPALEELLILAKTVGNFKKDGEGKYILPMGDNLRLIKIGKTFSIEYTGKPEPETETEIDKADEKLVSDNS